MHTGADKYLARPWKEKIYNEQDSQHYTKAYSVLTPATYYYCIYAISLCIVLKVLVAVACFLPRLF